MHALAEKKSTFAILHQLFKILIALLLVACEPSGLIPQMASHGLETSGVENKRLTKSALAWRENDPSFEFAALDLRAGGNQPDRYGVVAQNKKLSVNSFLS